MRLPEQRLWDRMRAAFKEHGVLAHRIENIVGEGMPDVVAARRGCVTFIELKAIEHSPARASTPLLGKQRGLSAAQLNWHWDWNAAGCSTLIVIGVAQEILVIDGRKADMVNVMTYAQARDASWAETLTELVGLL